MPRYRDERDPLPAVLRILNKMLPAKPPPDRKTGQNHGEDMLLWGYGCRQSGDPEELIRQMLELGQEKKK